MLDVVGVLAEDPHGAGVVAGAEDEGAGVGEVARQIGLEAADGPLLEDVGEHLAVGDRDVAARRPQSVHDVVVLGEQPERTGLPDPREGERRGPSAPAHDGRDGEVDVARGPDPDETERLTEEGRLLVVVELGAREADVDDHGAAHALILANSSSMRSAMVSGSGTSPASPAMPMLTYPL